MAGARDATGSYTASYALMALFAILISLVMLVLRLVEKRPPAKSL